MHYFDVKMAYKVEGLLVPKEQVHYTDIVWAGCALRAKIRAKQSIRILCATQQLSVTDMEVRDVSQVPDDLINWIST